MASAGRTSKSSGTSTKPAGVRLPSIRSRALRFVVCVKDGGYVDLERLKVYRARHNPADKAAGMLRVLDASGEDYLYPAAYFRPIVASKNLFALATG